MSIRYRQLQADSFIARFSSGYGFLSMAWDSVIHPMERRRMFVKGKLEGNYSSQSFEDAANLVGMGLSIVITGKIFYSIANGEITWFDTPVPTGEKE